MARKAHFNGTGGDQYITAATQNNRRKALPAPYIPSPKKGHRWSKKGQLIPRFQNDD